MDIEQDPRVIRLKEQIQSENDRRELMKLVDQLMVILYEFEQKTDGHV